jgi:hypothetical protein
MKAHTPFCEERKGALNLELPARDRSQRLLDARLLNRIRLHRATVIEEASNLRSQTPILRGLRSPLDQTSSDHRARRAHVEALEVVNLSYFRHERSPLPE